MIHLNAKTSIVVPIMVAIETVVRKVSEQKKTSGNDKKDCKQLLKRLSVKYNLSSRYLESFKKME